MPRPALFALLAPLLAAAALLSPAARAEEPAAAPAPAVSPAPAVAPAPAPAAQYECTSFPVRSTTAMGPFQAPADVSAAKVNPTRLPAGWAPVGGSIGEGGAFVLACRVVGG
jgi:hypothetical protein